MPSDTDYARHDFLKVPHPAKINPVALFVKHVRGARFPVGKSQTRISTELGGTTGILLCDEIKASKDVPWSDADVRSIVRRLVEWWDTDKEHLKRRVDVAGQFLPIGDDLKKRLSELVVTLAAVIVRRSDSIEDESTRNALKRTVEEFSEYKLPPLAVEMACVSLFPEWRDRVVCQVEDAMTSTSDEVVIDALTAIQVISERAAADTEAVETDKEDLARLVSAAGHMIRWRRNTVLPVTINTVADVVGTHPWTFADDVERSVLLGLHRLIGDTAIHGVGTTRINKTENCQDVSTKLRERRAHAVVTVLLKGDTVVSASRFCLSVTESVAALREYNEGSVAPMELRCWQGHTMTGEQTRSLAELTIVWRESSGQRKDQDESDWRAFFVDVDRKTRRTGRTAAISVPTRNQVLLDAHGRCMFEGCGADLTEDPVTRVRGNFATLAHNVAASEGGTRGALYLSAGLADDPENILLLCDTHHRLVDTVARTD